MERKDNQIDSESILDELYFVIDFNTLARNTGINLRTLKSFLSDLIERELVNQLEYNNEIKDFEKRLTPDILSLEKHHYIASKKGLLYFNSR